MKKIWIYRLTIPAILKRAVPENPGSRRPNEGVADIDAGGDAPVSLRMSSLYARHQPLVSVLID